MTQERPLLSIVTPVYNEELLVAEFFEKISGVLTTITHKWELVFVNDGSDDMTLSELIACQQQDKRVVIVDFSRNFGKEAALSAGLRYSRGRAVIPVDVDLQDPPELIVKMVEAWREGHDVVLAARRRRDGDTQLKKKTAAIFFWFINVISSINIPKNVGDFRLMDRKVVKCINALPERNRMMKGLFAWMGFSTTVVTYDRPHRRAGKTKFSYRSLLHLGCNGIMEFSVLPLRIWFYVAVVLLIMACVSPLYWNGEWSVVQLLLFVGGLQFFAVGVLGEYIARIYDEVKGRPLYIVKDVYRGM